MSNQDSSTVINFVLKGEYFLSEMSPTYNPYTILKDVVEKELVHALLSNFLQFPVSYGLIHESTAKTLKENGSKLIEISQLTCESYDLRESKQDEDSPDIGIEIKVKLKVDPRLDIPYENIEEAIGDAVERKSGSLENLVIEKSLVTLQNENLANDFADIVYDLHNQVESHQLKSCIIDEHSKMSPPISVDEIFNCLEKFNDNGAGASFAFKATQLKAIENELKPKPVQELEPATQLESEPGSQFSNYRSVKIM